VSQKGDECPDAPAFLHQDCGGYTLSTWKSVILVRELGAGLRDARTVAPRALGGRPAAASGAFDDQSHGFPAADAQTGQPAAHLVGVEGVDECR
jgi:hypothetical protein